VGKEVRERGPGEREVGKIADVLPVYSWAPERRRPERREKQTPAGYFLEAMTYPTSYALKRSVVSGKNLGADDTWTPALSQSPTGQGGRGMFYVSSYDSAGNLVLRANSDW
jgi:hypothetical protein